MFRKDEGTILAPEDMYLMSGVHIGTQQKNSDMLKYVYKVRSDGLYILNIRYTDLRIRIAARMIARYSPEDVVAVSARQYAEKPVKMFAEVTGVKAITGRFIPGTFTNPQLPTYMEPELVIISDPAIDRQALTEAVQINVPVIAFCDVNNSTRFVDLVIPANNKGRKSLAFIYYLLAREVLKVTGRIQSYTEFQYKPEDFETQL